MVLLTAVPHIEIPQKMRFCTTVQKKCVLDQILLHFCIVIQGQIQDFPEKVTDPKGGMHQPFIWPNFPENCMEMKKFGRGGVTHLKKIDYVDLPLLILS